MPTLKDRSLLEMAVIGYNLKLAEIAAKIAGIEQRLGRRPDKHSARTAKPVTAAKPKGKISAEGRARIAEGQRKRWAALRNASEPATAAAPPKTRRNLSEAGRAAIVAATKKRWAAVRALANKAKGSPSKKPSVKTAEVKSARTTIPEAPVSAKQPAPTVANKVRAKKETTRKTVSGTAKNNAKAAAAVQPEISKTGVDVPQETVAG